MNELNTVEVYAFEIFERIIRFYSHLNSIDEEFYNDNQYADKQKLIFEYKDVLLKLLRGGIKLVSSPDSDCEKYQLAETIMHAIVELHSKYLYYLPRPSEPVELRRFTRIIDTKQQTLQKISIFPSEKVGEETYFISPLLKYTNEVLEDCILTIDGLNPKTSALENSDHRDPVETVMNIAIPRIDVRNPCRWATILHEIGHHQMHKLDGQIMEHFETFINTSPVYTQICERVFDGNENKKERWITEIWCDLYAAVSIGPAIWFSQFVAFLFANRLYSKEDELYGGNYPPAFIRLKVIAAILSHRFPSITNNELIEGLMDQYEELMGKIFKYKNAVKSSDLQNLTYTLIYFFRDDFKNEKLTNIREGLSKGFESVDVDMAKIEQMVNRLDEGLPIPCIPSSDIANVNESVAGLPAILLAAWLHRCGNLRKYVMDSVKDFDHASNKQSFETFLVETLMPHFEAFDNSILRSVQVSEWVELYQDGAKTDKIEALDIKPQENTSPFGLLVDHEILSYLNASISKEKLLIIPIINLQNQLGAASFDVRLGTSFEVFFPNEHGAIDFTAPENENRSAQQSKVVDLDCIESITIHPGQFVLAHTMEYIKLPHSLAAEIDGRSSFARMGLEIHLSAGFIDPGFEGVITLEIYNAGSMPIKLIPGYRIAQLRFLKVTIPTKSYGQRGRSKYKRLLSHNRSLQMKDDEILCIRKKLANIKKGNM
jgi:dCTP deaminase